MKHQRIKARIAACLFCSLALTMAGLAEPEPAPIAFVHETTDSYTTRDMHGFTVHISSAAMAHPETTDPALTLLGEKLVQVIELTPEPTHAPLRRVAIWVEQNSPGAACACYHPSADWLAQNGFNTDKAKGIEISNTTHFVDWTDRYQPMMVLHELAHAYHHTVIGYDNQRIIECYQRAKASGKYDSVKHVSGKMQRHYAMNNEQEFFAELSESYFGRNDFAPFDRDELRAFDPESYAMIEAMWNRAGEGKGEVKSDD